MKKNKLIIFILLSFFFCNKGMSDNSLYVKKNNNIELNDTSNEDDNKKQVIKSSKYLILHKKKSFLEQVTKPNYIYEIKYDFDLKGETVKLPANCTLKFNGGKLFNGHIISNYTKLVGTIPSLRISGIILDSKGREINPKTYSPRKVDLRIHSSFSMFNQSMSDENMIDKYNMYKDCGINTLWLCILLEYHKDKNIIKVPSWYKKYHELGGLKGMIKYLEKELGTQVDCVKLHKNYFFKDTPAEPEAYYVFCKDIIDILYELGIKKIFISNEEPKRTQAGSMWVDSFNRIIDYAHLKGIKVGFSMNAYKTTIENLDQSFIDKVDMLYENFYPTLSSKDLNTEYSDLPRMIKLCEAGIRKSMRALEKRNVLYKYGISECGIVGRVKALRYPYNWKDKSEIDNTGKIIDLYWRSVIPAVINTEVKEVANWYMDEYKRDRFKESMFDFIFHSIW